MINTNNNFVYADLDSYQTYAWKYLLQSFTLNDINKNFESYRSSCLSHSNTFNLIKNNIKNMFNVIYKEEKFYPHFKHSIISEMGGTNQPLYFFRIRKIENGVHFNSDNNNKIIPESFVFEDIQKTSDVWEKPSFLVNHYQRLSKPQESVLYTSLMPSTAILEMDINQDNSLFFLIVYKSKRKIVYNDCCNFVYYNNLSEEENMKRYIIFDFLRNEFTRILPKTYYSENQYCAAEAISKKFFISDDTEGIQYPSARGIKQYNFAFFSNSIHNCLEFVGLRCCKFINRNEIETNHKVFADGFWNETLEKFEYYSPYSDKSKQVFGDNILLDILMSK